MRLRKWISLDPHDQDMMVMFLRNIVEGVGDETLSMEEVDDYIESVFEILDAEGGPLRSSQVKDPSNPEKTGM